MFGQRQDNNNDADSDPDRVSMDFFLARVQLAQLCREITDTVSLETTSMLLAPHNHMYERIVALDQKLQDFLSSGLPVSLRGDPESLPLEALWPHLSTMRYHITTATHARRCRLNQKMLLRQTADRRFAYSRRAALESARAILRMYQEREARKEDAGGDVDIPAPPAIAVARMGIVVHYTHLALVVLVMDLCFNKTAEDHGQVRQDVAAAMQQLDGVGHLSGLIGRSLDALRAVLENHHVPVDQDSLVPVGEPLFSSGSGGEQGGDFVQSGYDAMMPGAFVWESIVQQDAAYGLDSVAWDTLFSSLDTHPF
jgi:hypothetical protein